jgi:hypothetical protein
MASNLNIDEHSTGVLDNYTVWVRAETQGFSACLTDRSQSNFPDVLTGFPTLDAALTAILQELRNRLADQSITLSSIKWRRTGELAAIGY